MRAQDFLRYSTSSSLQIRMHSEFCGLTPRYLRLRCPITLARTVAQIRLANVYSCSLLANNKSFKVETKKYCKLCHFELECFVHIIFRCPFYQHLRVTHFNDIIEDKFEEDWLANLLNIQNPKQMKQLAYFIIQALEFRDSYLCQDF